MFVYVAHFFSMELAEELAFTVQSLPSSVCERSNLRGLGEVQTVRVVRLMGVHQVQIEENIFVCVMTQPTRRLLSQVLRVRIPVEVPFPRRKVYGFKTLAESVLYMDSIVANDPSTCETSCT